MATKNSRNAGLYLCATLGGTYVKVTKTHGLKYASPTDFSEDTGHGQTYKTKLPGLQDWAATIMAWYDTAYTTLEGMSKNKVSEYFLLYPDVSDTTNYDRGQCYITVNEKNMDIGNTVGFSYDAVLASEDLVIIRNGSPL